MCGTMASFSLNAKVACIRKDKAIGTEHYMYVQGLCAIASQVANDVATYLRVQEETAARNADADAKLRQ
jgi:hypothetical protein